jgi:hypothetical protein
MKTHIETTESNSNNGGGDHLLRSGNGFTWSGPNDGAYDFVNSMSWSKEGSGRQPNGAWSGRTLQGASGLN